MFDRELTGQFWLPDRPPDGSFGGVGGVLRFSRADGLVLELSDQLGADHFDARDSDEVILGVSHDAKEITLFGCLRTNWNMSTSAGGWAIAKATYRPQFGYIGAHLPDEEDRTFIDVAVSIDGLASWVSSASFETEFPVDRTLPSSARYIPPSGCQAVWGSTKVRLESYLETSEERRSVTLKEGWRFDIALEASISLNEILTFYVQPLLNLITLVSQRPAVIQAISVHSESARERRRPEIFRPIEVLYSPIGTAELLETYSRPLIALSNFPIDFDDFLPRWLAASEDSALGPVLNAYFGIQYSPPEFVDLGFLTMATALESYHERRYPEATLIPEESLRWTSTLTELARQSDDFGAEGRKWLKGLLKTANRPALHQRIQCLLDDVDSCHPEPLAETGLIAVKLATTRNHLAHGTEKLAERALTGLDRFWGEQLLHVTLANLLLKELGLDNSFIADAWRSHPWYAWARRGIGTIEWA